MPFAIKRVFYVYDVPGGATRGAHAHKTCTEVLIPVSGSFDIHLSDGKEERIYHMARSNQGLIIPPGFWLSCHDYTTGTVCLVLCSDYYDEGDYIRDFEEFCEFIEKKQKGA